MLTPVGAGCEDAWIRARRSPPLTERCASSSRSGPGSSCRPGRPAGGDASSGSPAAGSLLNIVTGGDPAEQRAYGDFLDHDERYARTDEFLDRLRAAVGRRAVRPRGHATTTSTAAASRRWPPTAPPIYFGGASPAAERVAARHADVYLAWGEPPPALAERLDADARRSPPTTAGAALRPAAARHRPRHRRGGLGRGRRLLAGMDPDADRRGPGAVRDGWTPSARGA